MYFKRRNITVPINKEVQRIHTHTERERENHLELISEFTKIAECKVNT